MAGRKSKYTPETVQKIVNALSVGMTDRDAAHIGGISHETFYRWRETKSDFYDRTTRAREEGWQASLAVIRRSALEGDWRAAAEHLDRTRSPYRKSQETVLSNGEQGQAFVIQFGARQDGPQ